MSSKLFTVFKFEYFQTLKRPGFWLSTLFFPIFIVVIIAISGYSSITATQNAEQALADTSQTIVVVDQAGIIEPQILGENYETGQDLDQQIERVQNQEIRAVFYIPNNFPETKNYEIYAQDQGLFANFSYPDVFNRLIKATIASELEDSQVSQLFNAGFNPQTTMYYDESGQPVESGLGALILPIASFIIFFMAVFISAQYLLQSVAEEKENRMIETILSVLNSRTLIVGKILGLSLVVLTQLGIWLLGGVISLLAAQSYLDLTEFVDLSSVWDSIQPGAVLVTVLMTFLGFLFFSAIMVGVGSVAANYKDSQSLSSVFIISAIFPIYFISALVSDPTGPIAQIFTYFPTTSALVLLFRNSLGALTAWELALGIALNLAYVALAFWIAVKLFDLGILMYNRKPTWKEVGGMFRK
jgi:ABC-2 type transport system permease protein